jgi:hypothetical protein
VHGNRVVVIGPCLLSSNWLCLVSAQERQDLRTAVVCLGMGRERRRPGERGISGPGE